MLYNTRLIKTVCPGNFEKIPPLLAKEGDQEGGNSMKYGICQPQLSMDVLFPISVVLAFAV